QPALTQAIRTLATQEVDNTFLAAIDALLGEFDAATYSKKFRCCIPHVAVEVVTIAALQVLDLLFVTQHADALQEFRCKMRAVDFCRQRRNCASLPGLAVCAGAGIGVGKGRDTGSGEAAIALA